MSKSSSKLVFAAAAVLASWLTAGSVQAQVPPERVEQPAAVPAPGHGPAQPASPHADHDDHAGHDHGPGFGKGYEPPVERPRAAANPNLTAQLSLTLDGKQTGPLEMKWDGAAYAGSFKVHNEGLGPLLVSSIAIRSSDKQMVAPGVTAKFDDGSTSAMVPPRGDKTVTVRWDSGQAKVTELYGHVVVESNTADRQPAAIGIHAEKPFGPSWLFNHILSWLTFLPLVGVVGIFLLHLIGYKKDEYIKWGVLGLMGVNLALSLWLYSAFDGTIGKFDGNGGLQFIEHGTWIRSLNVEYFMGVDGISISMVVLTTLVSFVAAIASFSVKVKLKGYWAMFCLLVTGMMGVFVALDLFMFYVFWEVMLLPMYFLIGIWGGPRKEYAAIKFFLYTLAGSVFMLLAFIAFYYNADQTFLVDGTRVPHTFSIPELMQVDWVGKNLTILGMSFPKLLWVVLFIGFAIKVPMFPFHTWLPDAHVEAPTAISVILAGVLLKMGIYGMLRINYGILPEATQWAATAIAVFGVINILYGAFCAMAQSDLKRLVAYSSVSHMGFCLLGMAALTPQGIQAAIVQMFNHGTITAMLFTLVGVVYDRAHTRDIGRFGGLATEMPFYTAFFGFAFMASLGLPGLSGFIGEALTFMGAFPVYPMLTILAATGVIFTAGYHLWALQRVFLGKFRQEWRTSHALEEWGGKFPEMNLRETLSLAPMAVIVLVLGFWPRPLLDMIDGGVMDLTALVNAPGAMQIASATDAASRLAAFFH